MKLPHDYGPWSRVLMPARPRCMSCHVPIVSHAPAFWCERTGRYLCGPCGVKIVVHHHNEQREEVNT